MRKSIYFFILWASVAALTVSGGQARSLKTTRRPVFRRTAAVTNWSAPINISQTSSHSASPILDLDAKGNAYVSWTEWTGYRMARDMMFNTNASGQWAAAKVVAPLMYNAIDDVGFPTIAVAADGTAYISYHDGVINSMEILLWEYDQGRLSDTFINLSETQGGSSAYVALAVSPVDQYAYAVWMEGTFFEYDLAFRWRNPDSGRWEPTVFLPLQPGTPKYLYQVNNFFIDAQGTAHLTYITRLYGSQVWYTKNSTPRNVNTWTEPYLVSPNTGLPWTFPRITADKDGDVYVVWHEFSDGNEEIMLRRTAGGQWQAAENISQTSQPSENPAIAVDPATKELYIAWQERVEGTNWDVYLKSFEQQPGTAEKKWMGPVNFSGTPGMSGDPSLRALANGDIHMVYFDNLNQEDGRAEILYTAKIKQRLYAPLNLSVKTAIIKILFFQEKMNTVTFDRNDLNEETLLSGYKLFRRRAEDSDDDLVLVATLDLSTRQYLDRGLPVGQKYAYVVSAVDRDGNEARSNIVIEP